MKAQKTNTQKDDVIHGNSWQEEEDNAKAQGSNEQLLDVIGIRVNARPEWIQLFASEQAK